MFTKTTETAIMALLYLTLHPARRPVPPRQVAGYLSLSSSYLAKVFTRLVQAGILQAHRGAQGGVTLRRPPTAITLLDVVQACQGSLADRTSAEPHRTRCSFHQAVFGLEQSVMQSLSDWSLERMAADPCPVGVDERDTACHLAEMCPKRRQKLASGRDDLGGE